MQSICCKTWTWLLQHFIGSCAVADLIQVQPPLRLLPQQPPKINNNIQLSQCKKKLDGCTFCFLETIVWTITKMHFFRAITKLQFWRQRTFVDKVVSTTKTATAFQGSFCNDCNFFFCTSRWYPWFRICVESTTETETKTF